MNGRDLRDKLYKDDEFLDLLSMIKDTHYARQNCIYQINGDANVLDFDSDSDITTLITQIAYTIKQDENILMKMVKQFLFSITTLFYIWDNVTTASYIDNRSKLKYKLGFAAKQAKVSRATYDYSVTFNISPLRAVFYIKPYTTTVTKNLDLVAVSVEVTKDSVKDDQYLQNIQFYFYNIDAKCGFYRTLDINNISMDQIMISIKDASTRNY